MTRSFENFDKEVVYFARTDFRDQQKLFGIRRVDRRQHMYIIGKTGTGKSVLLHNIIIQDIANGEGVCVVDPHGELVENLLGKIPKSRMNDVIYFNPADPDFHIGFNVLELPDPKYKHLVASGLMGIFTKIWSNVWSARMEYILNNAILALLDTPGSTLLGIPRLLVDKDYRQKIVNNIQDPVVKAFWVHEYEEWRADFRNEAIVPILNKVGQFLATPIIRNVVGQSKSTLNIFEVMNTGKILLINVSKGRIGEDNSALLGGMLITKIQLSAMERVRLPEEERVDFYLYVDEFQNFATDSFADVLSEARKYRLNLILAHQYVGQLATDVSTKVRDAIFGNVGTIIVFRVGAADAEFLEKEFAPEFNAQDIVNLPNYRIYLKLMVNGVTSRPFSAQTLKPFKVKSSLFADPQEIIQNSRKRYSRPRYSVEEEINRWSEMMVAENKTGVPSGGVGGNKHQAICSICGRPAIVPFEPNEGRAVYCSDCFKKIQAGELEPVTKNVFSDKARENYEANLAALGIEFSKREPKPNVRKPNSYRPSKSKVFIESLPPDVSSEQTRKSGKESRVTETKPTIYLKDLKTSPPVQKEKEKTKTPVDIKSLREELRKALENLQKKQE